MKHQMKFMLTASVIALTSFAHAQITDEIQVISVRSRSSPEKIETLLSGPSVRNLIAEKNLNMNLGSLRIQDEVVQEDGETELLKKGRKVSVSLSQGKIQVSAIIKSSGSNIDLSEYTAEQQSALNDLLKNGLYISYTLSDCKNIVVSNSQMSKDKLLVVCNKIEKIVRNSKAQNIGDMAPKNEDDDAHHQQQAVISFTGAKLSKDQIPSLKKISGKTMIHFNSETSDTLSSDELELLISRGLLTEEFDGSDVVQFSGSSIE